MNAAKITVPRLRFTQPDGTPFPDWEEKRLGDVANKTASSLSANQIKEVDKGYLVYGADGIIGRINTFQIEAPYFGVVKDGAGVGTVFKCEAQSSVLGTIDAIKATPPNSTDFVYHLFSNLQFRKFVSGSTIPHVYFSHYSQSFLKLPHPDEQAKIAEALSDADALITSLEKLIEKKKAIKQGAMQQLLTGEKRLLGFDGDWVEDNLGNLCDTITTGKLDANAMEENGKHRFFTCAAEPYFIDVPAFSGDAILLSGNGVNIGYVHKYSGEFNAYQRTYVLQDFKADHDYVYHQLVSGFREHIEPFVNGGNTPYITLPTVQSMSFHCPSLDEQQAIAEALSDADEEINQAYEKLHKAKKIKAGMMQELLTGRTHLI